MLLDKLRTMTKTMKFKAFALASPHLLCCGVLPFLSAFGGELLPWVDNLWIKMAMAVGLTALILFVDDFWHKNTKTPHVGPCETLHGKKGTSFKKYAFWLSFAAFVTATLHFIDMQLFHN